VECPVLHSRGPAETRRIGARLGRLLQPGDVLLLQGELGSGKTVLAQGIGQGLAVREPVKSSSYVLLNEYHGRLTVYHADLFRLDDPGQVAELALEEVAAPGVLLVEWPERAWEELPPEHLLVRIEEGSARPGPSGSRRRLSFVPQGSRYEELAQLLTPRRHARRG
jgi:tRNA threonylcarbamoyladenosine biosynthesis protein TsaE